MSFEEIEKKIKNLGKFFVKLWKVRVKCAEISKFYFDIFGGYFMENCSITYEKFKKKLVKILIKFILNFEKRMLQDKENYLKLFKMKNSPYCGMYFLFLPQKLSKFFFRFDSC